MPHRKINNGVYEVDFDGKTTAEFSAPHPAIVVRTIAEPELFYIVPLTSYTPERWKVLRKRGCCRILSTGSIARVDKIQVLHERRIVQRYLKQYKLLLPEPDEIEIVHDHIIQYLSLGFEKSRKEYKRFYAQATQFQEDSQKAFSHRVTETLFTQESETVLSYPLSKVNLLTFDDILRTLRALAPFGFHVSFDKEQGKMLVILPIQKSSGADVDKTK